jgi:hypothetical protein
MARAIEPEAARLGALAVDETGYGNAADKRIKNLFNSVSIAEWLRDIKTLGVLWQDDVTKVAAVGEPMGVVAALIYGAWRHDLIRDGRWSGCRRAPLCRGTRWRGGLSVVT